MDRQSDTDRKSEESANFLGRHFHALILSLVAFFLLAYLVGYFLQPHLEQVTQWLSKVLGIWGLASLIFIGDLFPNPLPPDLVLLVVAQPPFRDAWGWIVLSLGGVSMLAGLIDYGVGKMIARTAFGQNQKQKLEAEYGHLIKKYGFWVVFIGALTPLPFSVTCWAAGYFSLSMPLFLFAAAMRIPRFYIYFVVIDIGLQLPSMF